MKIGFIPFTFFLVFLSLILSVSAQPPSWHNIETQTFRVGSLYNQYSYVVHGPFTEDGLAYNGLIVVTISFEDQTPLTFTLSNGGMYIFTSQYHARTMFWNLTTNYNMSRQIVFGSAFMNEVYLYVYNAASEIMELYDVSITDMVGLTNATCETDKNVLGINQIIERQQFDPINTMSFYLLRYSTYSIKVVSDQGTFVWSLPTDTGTAISHSVTRDMVTQTSSLTNITSYATRLNGTSATVYFNDPSHSTVSVTSRIYIMNTTGQYLFYTQTDAGYVQNFTVNNLVATTNYVVKTVTASGSWINQLSALPTTTLVWGVSFDILGSWALYVRNSIGMFIVTALISVGSWKDTEWFLGAGVVVAAFLVSIGFMSIPWMGISIALLVVVLMYIDKAKKESIYS